MTAHARRTPSVRTLLAELAGVVSDPAVAARTGLSLSAVRRYRRAHGLASPCPGGRTPYDVAARIAETYGEPMLRRLLGGFVARESGQLLGEEFGVSRETIANWRAWLGSSTSRYVLHPEIEVIAEEGRPRGVGAPTERPPGD